MSEEHTNESYTNELVTSDWKSIAKSYGADFGEHTQAELKREFKICESAPYFGLCIRNAVNLNPVLNRSRVVRTKISEFSY